MRSREVLLLAFIAFAMVNGYVGEKICPERAIPVATPEGMLCVCSQGYSGEHCQFKGRISNCNLLTIVNCNSLGTQK
jgi:hypothetical protein